jgi:catalase-peroxidase
MENMNNQKREENVRFRWGGTVAKQSAGSAANNREWWPNQLRLNVLRQHSSLSNPMGETFNYAEAFKTLILTL